MIQVVKGGMQSIEVIDEREVLGKDFRIYGTIEEPLFLAKDVAEWIDYGYSNKEKGIRKVSQMLKTVDDEEKLKETIEFGGQGREMWFLTKKGLIRILTNSRKAKAKKLLEELDEEIEVHSFKNMPKQTSFTILLENAIKEHIEGFDWKFCPFNNESDYLLTYDDAMYFVEEYTIPTTNYKVDYFFPKFNLIVEYDEKHHEHQIEIDVRRQKEIESVNEFYEFIRVKEGEEFKGIIKIITALSRVFVF